MTMRSPPHVGILADDLTSAADGASPFVGWGLSALVGKAVFRRRLPMSLQSTRVRVQRR